MSLSLGTIANARSEEQRTHMQQTVERGICPFCDLNTTLNKVIIQTPHWRAWPNPFPYSRHAHHFVLAPREHITSISALLKIPEAIQERDWICDELIRQFNLEGGAVVMRFGNPKRNAGTLTHLHVHVQAPDGTGPAFSVFSKINWKAPWTQIFNQIRELLRAFC